MFNNQKQLNLYVFDIGPNDSGFSTGSAVTSTRVQIPVQAYFMILFEPIVKNLRLSYMTSIQKFFCGFFVLFFPANFLYSTLVRYRTKNGEASMLPGHSVEALKTSMEAIFFYRFYQQSQYLHSPSTMGKLHDLRSSLSMLVKRSYFLDRWISDNSLLSILQNNYNLHNINKYYLDRYIVNVGLNSINIYRHKEDNLTNNRRTFFYLYERKLTSKKVVKRRIHSLSLQLS